MSSPAFGMSSRMFGDLVMTSYSPNSAPSGGAVLPKLEAALQSMMERHFGGKSQHIYEKAKHTQTLDLFTFTPSEWKMNDTRLGLFSALAVVELYITFEADGEYDVMTKSPIILELIPKVGQLISQAYKNATAKEEPFFVRTAAFKSLPLRSPAEAGFMTWEPLSLDDAVMKQERKVVSMVDKHMSGPLRDEFMRIVHTRSRLTSSERLHSEQPY